MMKINKFKEVLQTTRQPSKGSRINIMIHYKGLGKLRFEKDCIFGFLCLLTALLFIISPAWAQGSCASQWTQVSGFDLKDVTYGNGRFIAVGENGAIFTSSDGLNWSAPISVKGNTLNAVTSNDSLFVAVGGDSFRGENGTILTSPDGVNWSEQFSPIPEALNGVTWNGSLFVAVGDSGTIITSPDGFSWTEQNLEWSWHLNAVTWDGSRFVAAGYDDDAMTAIILTSPDGTNWTEQLLDIPEGVRDIIWNGSIFVATGEFGSILTSFDGFDWTAQVSGTSLSIRAISWNGSRFVAVGQGGDILTSRCGSTSPVYRFWSDTQQAHFYTIDEEEKEYVIATYPENVWRYEGIAFYAYPVR